MMIKLDAKIIFNVKIEKIILILGSVVVLEIYPPNKDPYIANRLNHVIARPPEP